MGAEFVHADLTELVSSQAKVMLAGIDTLWHCSSFTSPWGTQKPSIRQRARHAPSGRVGRCRACVTLFISPLRRSTSTITTTGYPETFRPARFACEFARSKAASEEVIDLLAQSNPHTRFTILRPQSLFGPHDKVFIPRPRR